MFVRPYEDFLLGSLVCWFWLGFGFGFDFWLVSLGFEAFGFELVPPLPPLPVLFGKGYLSRVHTATTRPYVSRGPQDHVNIGILHVDFKG